MIQGAPCRVSPFGSGVPAAAASSYWRPETSRTGSGAGADFRPDLRRRLAPGLPPSAQPVEKPRRKERVTYTCPTAKAIAPRMITTIDGMSTPITTPRNPVKASTRQRSRALYWSSTSPSSHSATIPNAM